MLFKCIASLNYSTYLEETLSYQRIERLQDIERSTFFKIMNATQPAFYLRLRRSRGTFTKDELDAIYRLKELKLIEEGQDKKRSFLGKDIFYELTTSGLFYIFTNQLSYPPSLLARYNQNVILDTLLFPYFELESIERATSGFYHVITQYLHDCCITTSQRIDSVKKAGAVTSNAHLKNGNERHIKLLESDLQWQAKLMGFKLGLTYAESNILLMANSEEGATDNSRVALYELESKMKLSLSKDKRFMQFLEMVHSDFNCGYKELTELQKKEQSGF
jgi:hypothetical protein